MSKNNNSKFLILIVTVITLIIIISLFNNKFNVDNSEQITPVVQNKTQILQKRTKHVDPKIASITDSESSITFEEKKDKMQRKLNMSLMLKTPEKVIEVIETLQAQGKDELANEYIDYLLTTFPDFDY